MSNKPTATDNAPRRGRLLKPDQQPGAELVTPQNLEKLLRTLGEIKADAEVLAGKREANEHRVNLARRRILQCGLWAVVKPNSKEKAAK